MSLKQIVPNLYTVPLGVVNAFLLESDNGLTLIDTGSPGSADKILDAVRELGKQPNDVRRIIATHAHPDHIGSLAAVKRGTGAQVYMHPLDAPIARAGKGFRPVTRAPGFVTGIMYKLFIRPIENMTIEAAAVEHEMNDGDELPIAGGLKAIHAPGHCKGQVALLWPRHGGVLFAADACGNIPSLGWSLGYEDLEEGKRSLMKLSQFDFQVAVFGHGEAITQNASAQFRKKWGQASVAPSTLGVSR